MSVTGSGFEGGLVVHRPHAVAVKTFPKSQASSAAAARVLLITGLLFASLKNKKGQRSPRAFAGS